MVPTLNFVKKLPAHYAGGSLMLTTIGFLGYRVVKLSRDKNSIQEQTQNIYIKRIDNFLSWIFRIRQTTARPERAIVFPDLDELDVSRPLSLFKLQPIINQGQESDFQNNDWFTDFWFY